MKPAPTFHRFVSASKRCIVRRSLPVPLCHAFQGVSRSVGISLCLAASGNHALTLRRVNCLIISTCWAHASILQQAKSCFPGVCLSSDSSLHGQSSAIHVFLQRLPSQVKPHGRDVDLSANVSLMSQLMVVSRCATPSACLCFLRHGQA